MTFGLVILLCNHDRFIVNWFEYISDVSLQEIWDLTTGKNGSRRSLTTVFKG